MKKPWIIMIAIFALFLGCKKEDDKTDTNSSILVKREVTSLDRTINYSYIGNKLDKVSADNGFNIKYSYTGDLITRIDGYDKNGVSTGDYDVLTYSNNKLVQRKFYENNILTSLENTVYNSDGSVSVIPSDANGNSTNMAWFKHYYDAARRLIKIEQMFQNKISATNYYTYDNKNNPFKNIIGYDQIENSVNNIITEKTVSSYSTHESTRSYTYNSNDYPISSISTNSSGETYTGSFYYY